MPIISQETWDNMPSDEKQRIQTEYAGAMVNSKENIIVQVYEQIFGKENLRQLKRPKIWDDMEELHEDVDTAFVELEKSLADIDCETKLLNKILATYKIRYLIELGYGGMVTEKKWKDSYTLHTVCCSVNNKLHIQSQYATCKHFITFHTKEQAEDFMSYESNRKLVKQYYMI